MGSNKDNVLMFGYIDNGNLPNAPSWFLRNILLLIGASFDLLNKKIKIFLVRNLVDNLKDSLIIDISMSIDGGGDIKKLLSDRNNIRFVGWEKNAENKLLPKKINLS